MTNVATLVNNDIYRLGDAILYNSYNPAILKDNIYSKSFLYRYLIHMTRDRRKVGLMNELMPAVVNIDRRIYFATIALKELLAQRKWDVPDRNKLVVHLRLGDVISFKDNKYISYNELIKNISKSSKKSVVIVTAMHFPSETDNVEDLRARSLSLLNKLQDDITKLSKSVCVRSSYDVDSDFVFLCLSNELVLSGISSFGEVARMINKRIFNHA
jgi:hypothetical protein